METEINRNPSISAVASKQANTTLKCPELHDSKGAKVPKVAQKLRYEAKVDIMKH